MASKMMSDWAHAQHLRILSVKAVEEALTDLVERDALKLYAERLEDELRMVNMLLDDPDIPNDQWQTFDKLKHHLMSQQDEVALRLREHEEDDTLITAHTSRIRELQDNQANYIQEA